MHLNLLEPGEMYQFTDSQFEMIQEDVVAVINSEDFDLTSFEVWALRLSA